MFTERFLVVLLLLITFLQSETDLRYPGKDDKEFHSLTDNLNSTLWDEAVMEEAAFKIINSVRSPSELSNSLSEIKAGPQKTFLHALLLKKEGKYSGMFDSLYAISDQFPPDYRYYEELVFAANASGKIELLKKLSERKSWNRYSSYLQSLIFSVQGNFSEALKILSEGGGSSPVRELQKASLYRSLGDYEESATILSKILTQKISDHLKTKTYLALGAIYFLSGEYAESDKYYKNALTLAVKNNDRFNIAKAYINIGINEDVKGKIESAQNYFHKAFSLASDISENEIKANALSELGVSHTYTYDLSSALDSYLKSYSIYKLINNRVRLSLLSENIGKIYTQFHDYFTAQKYLEEGILYAGENKRALYLNISALADVHNNLSNYAKALQLYREAQNIADEIKDISLNGESVFRLGIINYNLGRYNNALEYYSRAGKLFIESDNWYTADLQHKTGLVYLETGQNELAEKYFRLALNKASDAEDEYIKASALIDFAELKRKMKSFDSALVMIKKAEAIAVSNNFMNLLGEARLGSGNIYRDKNDFFKAVELYTSAAKSAEEVSNYSLMTESLYHLALLYRTKNFDELAENYYRMAIETAEGKGRPQFTDQEVQISFFNLYSELYNSFASFYLEGKKYEDAFSILDRGRSRNTLQNITNLKLRSVIKNDSLVSRLYEYDWMLQSGIYEEKELDSISALYNDLLMSLTARFPAAGQYLKGSSHLPLERIRKSLDENENIILIHPADAVTYVFRISRNSFDAREETISSGEIKNIVSEISPYYSAENSSGFINQDLFAFNAAAAHDLYNRLVKNILSGIPENSSIVIVPCSELLLMPFEFLITDMKKNDSPYEYSDKKFLVNSYNISYSPSVSVYMTQKKISGHGGDKYLLIGNPFIADASDLSAERRSLSGEDTGFPLQPLKYSRDEINEIGNILETSSIYTEQEATETNFRKSAENSRIIHISSHSFLMNKQPVIFFSNYDDNESDGFLEASEVVSLNLNSDLVVLSSCNSGGGRIEEAEGIVGMTKAFFEAGTKSIIVSLWEVNDRHTSAFMKLFYQHLSKGINKNEALRLTKLDFIKEYSANPYYWSAFILAGDPAGMKIKTAAGFSSFLMPSLLLITSISLIIYYFRRKRGAVNTRV